jgi:brefeldin A-inhibited guanine nucleotide-exchange protein
LLHSLNPSDVGDFLANLDDDFLNAKQYEQLRVRYVSGLDFSGLGFSAALRVFLCDSGFRLPGEAQKIDRMLESFCGMFVAQNPGQFRNASSAFIVCFALVMLNTDLHDPRLRTGKSSRAPMTREQFIANLRGVDDGGNFPNDFLTRMFEDIRDKSIEWKENAPEASAPVKRASSFSRAEQVAQQATQQADQARRTTMQLKRRVDAQLRRALFTNQTWSSPTRSWVVAPLFDTTWYRALGTISFLADQSSTNLRRLDPLNLCLDGLAYGATIAAMLGGRTEFDAYLTVLAQVTFVESARIEQRKKMQMDEIARRHSTTVTKGMKESPQPAASPKAETAPVTDESTASSSSTPAASPTPAAFNPEVLWKQFDDDLAKRIARRQHLKQGWFTVSRRC